MEKLLSKISYTRITRTKVFRFLLILLPFADVLNGIFQMIFSFQISLGVVYRVIFLCVCLSICFERKFDRLDLSAVGLVAILFCSVFFHYQSSLHDEFVNFLTIALFPVTFVTLRAVRTIDKAFSLEKLFGFYCLVYPLTLIVPYLLGIGEAAYEDATGYKGFYIATNAISNIVIVTSVLSFYRLFHIGSLKNAAVCILNIFSVVLLGTKSGYLIVSVSFVVLALNALLHLAGRKRDRVVFILLALVLILIFGAAIFRDEIAKIFERWDYFYRQRDFWSFLTSARSERIGPAFAFIYGKPGNAIYALFGYGAISSEVLGYALMEMDFIDILLQYGIIGFAAFFWFLWMINRESRKFGKRNGVYRYLFFVILMIAFWVGHVLINALMATNLALICYEMCNRDREKRI